MTTINKYYEDDRGTIKMLLEDCKIGSISEISTFSNKTRANHWHKEDSHYILITSGNLEIYERPVNSNQKPIYKLLRTGALHFTDKLIEHTMYIPDFCSFLCFSKLPRNQDNYEKETVRFDYSLRDIYINWKE